MNFAYGTMSAVSAPESAARTRSRVQSLPASLTLYTTHLPSGLSTAARSEAVPSGANSAGSISTGPPAASVVRSSATVTTSWSWLPSLRSSR